MSQNYESGTCKSSRDCPQVVVLFRKGVPFTTCSFAGAVHIVCCPHEPTQREVPTVQEVKLKKPQPDDQRVRFSGELIDCGCLPNRFFLISFRWRTVCSWLWQQRRHLSKRFELPEGSRRVQFRRSADDLRVSKWKTDRLLSRIPWWNISNFYTSAVSL